MKQSSKLKRLHRRQKRYKAAGLNLVSLMDIFTILVFFLLINSGDVEILQVDDSLELPASVSERTPEDGTLLLMVNKESIIVEGRAIVDLNDLTLALAADAEKSAGVEIQLLAEELAYQASKKTELSDRQKEQGLAITIMGDKDTPYALLKSLIKTCTSQNYRDISLAVNQVPGSGTEDFLQPVIAPESGGDNSSVSKLELSAINI